MSKEECPEREEKHSMTTVTVSPSYEIVIPREIRETLQVEPGQKVEVLLYEDRIVLVPLKPIEKYRGFLKGIDTTIDKEPDRL
jgi:AbrB family looped-hinge helix DNA binding protein